MESTRTHLPIRFLPWLAASVVTLASVTSIAQAEFPREAVSRADKFLGTKQMGARILSYLHLTAAYRGHAPLEFHRVTDGKGKIRSGYFALSYRFSWGSDGETDLAFFFNPKGRIYKTRVLKTNAEIRQPFLAADVAIKTLGHLIIELFGEHLTAVQRKELDRIVEAADASSLLLFELQIAQAFN